MAGDSLMSDLFNKEGNIDFNRLVGILEDDNFNSIIPEALLKEMIGNQGVLNQILNDYKNGEEYLNIGLVNIQDNYLDKYKGKKSTPIMIKRLVTSRNLCFTKDKFFQTLNNYLLKKRNEMSLEDIAWCDNFIVRTDYTNKPLPKNIIVDNNTIDFGGYIALLETICFNRLIPPATIGEILNSNHLFKYIMELYKNGHNDIAFGFTDIPQNYLDNYHGMYTEQIKRIMNIKRVIFPKSLLVKGVSEYIHKHEGKLDSVVLRRGRAILDTFSISYFDKTIGANRVYESEYSLSDVLRLFLVNPSEFSIQLESFLRSYDCSYQQLFSVLRNAPFNIACPSMDNRYDFDCELFDNYGFDEENRKRFILNYNSLVVNFSKNYSVTANLSLYDIYDMIRSSYYQGSLNWVGRSPVTSHNIYQWIKSNNVDYSRLMADLERTVSEIKEIKNLPEEIVSELDTFYKVANAFRTMGKDYFFKYAKLDDDFVKKMFKGIPEEWHPIQKAYLLQYRMAKFLAYDAKYIASDSDPDSLKGKNTFSYVSKLGKKEDNKVINEVVCFSGNLALGLLWKEAGLECELVSKEKRMQTEDYGKYAVHMYLRGKALPFSINGDLARFLGRESDFVRASLDNKIDDFILKSGPLNDFKNLIAEVQNYISNVEEKGEKSLRKNVLDELEKYNGAPLEQKLAVFTNIMKKFKDLDQPAKSILVDLCLDELFENNSNISAESHCCRRVSEDNPHELVIYVKITNVNDFSAKYYLIDKDGIKPYLKEDVDALFSSGRVDILGNFGGHTVIQRRAS